MKEMEKRLRSYFLVEADQEENTRKEDQKMAGSREAAIQKIIFLAAGELRQRKQRKREGFGRFLLELWRVMGIRDWILPSCAVFLLYLLLYGLIGVKMQYFTPKRFAFLVSLLGILLFLPVIPFLYRTKRYQMLEIEATARYSIWRLVLARILMIGMGDLALLAGLIWWSARVSALSVVQTAFCLCIPFLLAFDGGLYLLRKVTFIHFQHCAYGMCLGMIGTLAGVALACPAYYEVELTFTVAGAFIVLIAGGIYQCVELLRENKTAVYC